MCSDQRHDDIQSCSYHYNEYRIEIAGENCRVLEHQAEVVKRSLDRIKEQSGVLHHLIRIGKSSEEDVEHRKQDGKRQQRADYHIDYVKNLFSGRIPDFFGFDDLIRFVRHIHLLTRDSIRSGVC